MVNLRTLNLAFQFVDLITGGLHRHRKLMKRGGVGIGYLRMFLEILFVQKKKSSKS